MNRVRYCLIAAALWVASCATPALRTPESTGIASADPSALKPVSAFTDIRDREQRSGAYFIEAGRVLQHPRCLNCHPKTRIPTQGDDLHAHVPLMHGTEAGHGVPALQCNTCHQSANFSTQLKSLGSIPGHPHWSLAPSSMAWQGLSLREICEQVKDPVRNGGRSLQEIHEHVAEDSLVGWAWRPGEGRAPAPGTQHEFGELMSAWIQTGAVCPGS